MIREVMLDTNAVSEFGRRKNLPLVQRVEAYARQTGRLTTSSVTLLEGLFGFLKAGRPQAASAFLDVLQTWEILPLDKDAAEIAAHMKAELQRNGSTIELADILIAAIAVANQRTLITGNLRHFEAIRDLGFTLELEDWKASPKP
jgi:tRNA(fMet)-specific endonuclease VapC